MHKPKTGMPNFLKSLSCSVCVYVVVCMGVHVCELGQGSSTETHHQLQPKKTCNAVLAINIATKGGKNCQTE